MKVTELRDTLKSMSVPFGRTAKKAELKALLLSVMDSNQATESGNSLQEDEALQDPDVDQQDEISNDETSEEVSPVHEDSPPPVDLEAAEEAAEAAEQEALQFQSEESPEQMEEDVEPMEQNDDVQEEATKEVMEEEEAVQEEETAEEHKEENQDEIQVELEVNNDDDLKETEWKDADEEVTTSLSEQLESKSETNERKRRHSENKETAKAEENNKMFAPPPEEAEEEFDEDLVVLDKSNSSLNIKLYNGRLTMSPLSMDGFAFLWGSSRATYGVNKGKVYYECKVGERNNARHLPPTHQKHAVRLGWSLSAAIDMCAGEHELSFAYCSTSKVVNNSKSKLYGKTFKTGDVIGCFMDMSGDENVVLVFTKNGESLGEAFTFEKKNLNGKFLFPHVSCLNTVVELNFGQNEKAFSEVPEEFSDYKMIGQIDLEDRKREVFAKTAKKDCQVVMMCGLPGCGKSHHSNKLCVENSEMNYNVIGTKALVAKMTVTGLADMRREEKVQIAFDIMPQFIDRACRTKRNYILDQANVSESSRLKMRQFEGFHRKAVVIVPTHDNYKQRCYKRYSEEGRDIPDPILFKMKASYTFPEQGSLFEEVEFLELSGEEAEKQITNYKIEARKRMAEFAGPGMKKFRPQGPGPMMRFGGPGMRPGMRPWGPGMRPPMMGRGGPGPFRGPMRFGGPVRPGFQGNNMGGGFGNRQNNQNNRGDWNANKNNSQQNNNNRGTSFSQTNNKTGQNHQQRQQNQTNQQNRSTARNTFQQPQKPMSDFDRAYQAQTAQIQASAQQSRVQQQKQTQHQQLTAQQQTQQQQAQQAQQLAQQYAQQQAAAVQAAAQQRQQQVTQTTAVVQPQTAYQVSGAQVAATAHPQVAVASQQQAYAYAAAAQQVAQSQPAQAADYSQQWAQYYTQQANAQAVQQAAAAQQQQVAVVQQQQVAQQQQAAAALNAQYSQYYASYQQAYSHAQLKK